MSDVTTTLAAPTPAPAPSDRPRRRRGFLWPLLLIAAGLLIFAAEYGYVPPISVRALLSLWPVILVLAGVEIIVGRRQPWLALAVEILIVAAAVAVAISAPRSGLFGAAPQGTSSARVERESARSLSLRVEGGAGAYTLRGGATALVEATSEGGQIAVRTDRRTDQADVRVQPTGDGFVFGSGVPSSVDVRVASDVLASVRVSGGAGDFTVDLRDVQVRDAIVETGASKLELTLPRASGEVSVSVRAGAATIVVIVPDGVEARITTAGGILTTTSQNGRLAGTPAARNSTTYETAGYAASKDRVTVSIEAGASSITIR